MERFVIISKGLQPLTVITKHSILDAAAAQDLLLDTTSHDGSMTDDVMSNYGLHQLIQEPTRELTIFFYRPNFHLSIKFSHGIKSPFIFTYKLSSSDSLSKI